MKHVHAWLKVSDMRNCVGERYTAYDTSQPLPRRSGYPNRQIGSEISLTGLQIRGARGRAMLVFGALAGQEPALI